VRNVCVLGFASVVSVVFNWAANLDILRKEVENRKKRRESAARADFIHELVAIHIFVIPRAAASARGGARAGRRKDLDRTVDNTIKTFILVERETVSGNEPARLQMAREFMEHLRIANCDEWPIARLIRHMTATHRFFEEAKDSDGLEELVEIVVEDWRRGGGVYVRVQFLGVGLGQRHFLESGVDVEVAEANPIV
jgi:hypothetical protein